MASFFPPSTVLDSWVQYVARETSMVKQDWNRQVAPPAGLKERRDWAPNLNFRPQQPWLHQDTLAEPELNCDSQEEDYRTQRPDGLAEPKREVAKRRLRGASDVRLGLDIHSMIRDIEYRLISPPNGFCKEFIRPFGRSHPSEVFTLPRKGKRRAAT